MPSQVTNYQCPACTGPLHFGEASGKLECDYCGSSYTVEEIEALHAEKNYSAEKAFEEEEAPPPQWDMDTAGGEWGSDAEKMRAYSCPSCGAELICEETTAATACPYCGNPTIIPGQFSGTKKPDLIIPFRFGKEEAIAALKRHYNHKPLLPKAFADNNHIQEIKGVYVPFWLFDAEVEADMTFAATRTHVHTTPNEIITETDHYLVHRQGHLRFEKIPVDAASKMPDTHMDAIEPYDYEELKPFALSYLPGFLADKYDVSQEDSSQRAQRRCENSAENAIRQTVLGYETCTATHRQMRVTPGDVKYALLPVWLLSTQWNGNNYLFAMNGQTGKLIGDLPMDRKKLVLWLAGSFAAATALLGWLFL